MSTYQSDCNLFVRPVPMLIGEPEVRAEFSKFGEVKSVMLKPMRYDSSLKNVYVLFATTAQAFAAIRGLDG